MVIFGFIFLLGSADRTLIKKVLILIAAAASLFTLCYECYVLATE